MEELEIVQTGEKSNGTFWARLQREVEGFIVTGFVSRKEPFEGDTIKVPTKVVAAIQWQS